MGFSSQRGEIKDDWLAMVPPDTTRGKVSCQTWQFEDSPVPLPATAQHTGNVHWVTLSMGADGGTGRTGLRLWQALITLTCHLGCCDSGLEQLRERSQLEPFAPTHTRAHPPLLAAFWVPVTLPGLMSPSTPPSLRFFSPRVPACKPVHPLVMWALRKAP